MENNDILGMLNFWKDSWESQIKIYFWKKSESEITFKEIYIG